jgi:hypothetical protein
MTEQADRVSDFERAATLRQTSDTFLQRLDRLLELETRKREMQPDRPEFVRLAREVEDLSRALLHTSGQQVDLAEEVHADVKRGTAKNVQPIRETPPKRDAVAVLSEWRAAERRLAAAVLDSDDEHEAQAAVERLRAEYRRITAPMPEDGRS